MPLTRREFFKTVLPWRSVCPSARPDDRLAVPGRFSLDMLKFLPDSVLQQMAPVRREGWTVTVLENGVAYRGEDGREGLVSLGPEACAAAQKFNGQATLEQIAGELELQPDWPPAQRYSLVRDTFLALAELEVFHPSGPPPGG